VLDHSIYLRIALVVGRIASGFDEINVRIWAASFYTRCQRRRQVSKRRSITFAAASSISSWACVSRGRWVWMFPRPTPSASTRSSS